MKKMALEEKKLKNIAIENKLELKCFMILI